MRNIKNYEKIFFFVAKNAFLQKVPFLFMEKHLNDNNIPFKVDPKVKAPTTAL